MLAGDELAKNPVGSKIMNALTFEHLMCRNNDELVTRQKLLKRKIMRRFPPIALPLLAHPPGLGLPSYGLGLDLTVRAICFEFT